MFDGNGSQAHRCLASSVFYRTDRSSRLDIIVITSLYHHHIPPATWAAPRLATFTIGLPRVPWLSSAARSNATSAPAKRQRSYISTPGSSVDTSVPCTSSVVRTRTWSSPRAGEYSLKRYPSPSLTFSGTARMRLATSRRRSASAASRPSCLSTLSSRSTPISSPQATTPKTSSQPPSMFSPPPPLVLTRSWRVSTATTASRLATNPHISCRLTS